LKTMTRVDDFLGQGLLRENLREDAKEWGGVRQKRTLPQYWKTRSLSGNKQSGGREKEFGQSKKCNGRNESIIQIRLKRTNDQSRAALVKEITIRLRKAKMLTKTGAKSDLVEPISSLKGGKSEKGGQEGKGHPKEQVALLGPGWNLTSTGGSYSCLSNSMIARTVGGSK